MSITGEVSSLAQKPRVSQVSDAGAAWVQNSTVMYRITALAQKTLDLMFYLHITGTSDFSRWMIPLNETKTVVDKAIDLSVFTRTWGSACRLTSAFFHQLKFAQNEEGLTPMEMKKEAEVKNACIQELLYFTSDIGRLLPVLEKLQFIALSPSLKAFSVYSVSAVKVIVSLYQVSHVMDQLDKLASLKAPLLKGENGKKEKKIWVVKAGKEEEVEVKEIENELNAYRKHCLLHLSTAIATFAVGVFSILLLVISSYNLMVNLALITAVKEVSIAIHHVVALMQHSHGMYNDKPIQIALSAM